MSEISIDNGLTFFAAADIIDQILAGNHWDAIVNAMNDELRERVHDELAPCSELEFLARYLELSESDLIIG